MTETKQLIKKVSCDNCVYGGRKVFGVGNPKAKIVVVGEAPGVLEISRGTPFTGPSGDLLLNALKKALPNSEKILQDVYFTNALQCLPKKKKDQKKLMEACGSCSHRLFAELEEHDRDVIIALGNAALWTLTGDYKKKITRERGNRYDSPLAKYGVVSALHPNHLLRGGGNPKQFQADIQYAVSLLDGVDVLAPPPEPKYTVVNNIWKYLELKEALYALEPGSVVGSDIETSGFDHLDNRILCTGFCFEEGHVYVVETPFLDKSLFREELEFAWHNGKFDIKFLRANGCPKARVDHDTMLLSYAMNEQGGVHDLEQVASDWLGAPNYKDMLEEYLPNKQTSYEVIPKPVLHKYLAIDAQLTFLLQDKMYKKLAEDEKLVHLYHKVLIPGSEYLAQIEAHGIKVDPIQVAKNSARMIEEANDCKNRLNALSIGIMGKEINPNSWQQIKELLYVNLQLGPKSFSTDKTTLEKLPKHPAVDLLLQYKLVNKALSTYVKPVLSNRSSDGRIHPSFLLHGTTTGRLACRSPNIQNVPRTGELREQYIPRDGCVFLEVDLSQAELRSLACLSRDTLMCEIYNSNTRNLHDEVAVERFGENFTKEQKMRAKALNFGIVYGRMAFSLAAEFEVPVREAQTWIDGWFTQFPGAHEFIERCRSAAAMGQTMSTVFGRKRRFDLVTRERLNNLQNEAANFPHQSIASDITMVTGSRLIQPLREKYNALIVNTVHDCLIVDIPNNEDQIYSAAKLIMDTMEKTPLEWGLDEVPFKAEAEVGPRWGQLEEIHVH